MKRLTNNAAKELVEQLPNPLPIPTVDAGVLDKIGYLTGDLGNRLLKLMKTGQMDTVTVTDNTVAYVDKSAWERHTARFKNNPNRFPDTVVFAHKLRTKDANGKTVASDEWKQVAVGAYATEFGRVKNMTQEIKYDYNQYWGAVICSQLLRAYPQGHKHIVVGLAHPVKSFAHRDQMIGATLGKHVVMNEAGQEITFIVREVLPWDEPVGGIVRWATSTHAEYNARQFRKGDRIMVADIGGGITSLNTVTVDFEGKQLKLIPTYDEERSPTIEMGIRNVMDKFRTLLLDEHPDFYGMKRLDDNMIEEGLRDGKIRLRGVAVDVRELRARAEYGLIDQIEFEYKNKMDEGRTFVLVVCVGGGMSTYYQRLKDEVWKHPAVEAANGELLDLIHFANMYGGDEIFRGWIVRQKGA
jgi:hypothetical protein